MSDCEINQYYVTREPVARKEHRCCECSAPILKGEKYLQVNACSAGQPWTNRQHLLCAEACMLVRDAGINSDECLYYGELYEFWKSDRPWYPEKEMPARRKLWRLMLRIHRRKQKSKREGLAA